MGITGWVCNTDNGGVEIVAQGEDAQIAEFLDWCRKGPDSARVTDVKVESEKLSLEYRDFQIKP